MLAGFLIWSMLTGVENDYATAYQRAAAESKLLVVTIGIDVDLNGLDAKYADDAVFCQLDDQATMEVDGKPVRLATHSSFDGVRRKIGLLVELRFISWE